jgi:molybdenum cofactor biosynthesis enzyme MoaA
MESRTPLARGTKEEFGGFVAEDSGRAEPNLGVWAAEPDLTSNSRDLTVREERYDLVPGRGVLRISLTPVCNLRCGHCHNEGQAKPWLHRAGTAAAIRDLDALIRAAAVRGVKTVRFTGGEPGMYAHFYELIPTIGTWRSALPSINKWALTTNGIPFLNLRKFSALADSALTHVAVGIDSIEPGERSRPSSPVGVSGREVFEGFVGPLSRRFAGQIKIDVVFTGDENRTRNVIRHAYALGLDVTVLEVNGVMEEKYDLGATFDELRQRVAEEFALTPRLCEDLNEIYLYDANGREVMKFYQDHCARRECDVCRKLDFRVVQSVEGLAAIPCYEQAQSRSIPLIMDGTVSDVRFNDAIKYNGRGPHWGTTLVR